MNKVLEFPICKIDDVVEDVMGNLPMLLSDLDSMIEYHDLEKPNQQKLFRDYSLERLTEVAEVILGDFTRADLMLEVLELKLLRHAQDTAADELDKPFMDALNAVRKARIHYIDRIGGKVFGAYDREMRPYRNLGGTPLFKDV